MNTHVSHQKTCLHYYNNISYKKSNQSRKKRKSFSDFAIQSDFSFAIIDKISLMSIFFLIGLKLLPKSAQEAKQGAYKYHHWYQQCVTVHHAQVHELPQSHCGENWEGTSFS